MTNVRTTRPYISVELVWKSKIWPDTANGADSVPDDESVIDHVRDVETHSSMKKILG